MSFRHIFLNNGFNSRDDFQSVYAIENPLDSSHLPTNSICVLFPDPSTPSTIIKAPSRLNSSIFIDLLFVLFIQLFYQIPLQELLEVF